MMIDMLIEVKSMFPLGEWGEDFLPGVPRALFWQEKMFYIMIRDGYMKLRSC